MQRINQFLDELYKESSLSPREIEEMKEEMKTHLLEHIEEAKRRGMKEEEAVSEALEQFGGETDIFEESSEKTKRKMRDKWFITSLLFLCLSLLLVGLVWGVEQVKEQQRLSFYNSIEGILYIEEKTNVEALENDVKRSIEKGIIKNVVITKGTHSSSPIIFKTIGTEGFPQDDSYLIETKEERIPTIHPNREDTYVIISSFNVIRFDSVIQFATILFISSLIMYIYRFVKNKRRSD